MPNVLADKAAIIGDRPFLHWDGHTYTYQDLDDLTNRVANGFADLYIRKGDHVALMFDNSPEFLWTLAGLGKLGAIAVPLNTAAKGEMLAYYLTQSDSTILCVSHVRLQRAASVSDQTPALRQVLVLAPSAADLAEAATPSDVRIGSWRA